jgi:hypothetical protein
MTKAIREALTDSSTALSIAELANCARAAAGDEVFETDWLGYGRFSNLLEDLEIESLVIETSIFPGLAYLEGVHQPPTEPRAREIPPRIRSVLREVGAPLWTKHEYRAVFEILEEYVRTHDFQLTETSKHVRDKMADRDLPVGRDGINFVLKGMLIVGHSFRDDSLAQTSTAFARLFASNVFYLADQKHLELSPEEVDSVAYWIWSDEEEAA